MFAERNGIRNDVTTPNPIGNYVHPWVKIAMITDVTSNTACFSEFAQDTNQCGTASNNQGKFGWAQPAIGGTAYTIRNVSTPNGCNGTSNDGSNWGIARSFHEGGVHVALMDGSVRFVSENIDGSTWAFLGRFDDGVPLGEF